MHLIGDLLYLIANALLAPCLVLLLVLFLWSLFTAGSFCREWLGRRPGTPDVAKVRVSAGSSESERTLWLDRREIEYEARVDRTALVSKVGPMLGLAGTLIPLGPALKGLADGRIAVLADNLIVAFTATVVGLFIAAVCFSIATVRRRWYERDLLELQAALEAPEPGP